MYRINVNRKILLLVFCVVFVSIFTLTIAYAALSTTLNIIGNAEISNASWNIKFNNIKVNSASVAISPQIINNTSLSFSANLVEPGDFYKFTVDIVNDGTIDAMIDSIVKTPELTTEQKKYLRYEVEYTDGQNISTKQLLKGNETKTISVLFSFRNDIPISDLPTSAVSFNVELQIVYYQANEDAINISNSGSKIQTLSGNLNTVGSEFCILEECFYLINNDGFNAFLLSKYNLYVGGYFDSSISILTEYDNFSGIQDATMLGYVSKQNIRSGVISFSSDSKKGDKYSDYNGSIVEEYVNSYKGYLESKDITISAARLITKDELYFLGCDASTKKCSSTYPFVYGTSYWSMSPYNDVQVWRISSTNEFDYDADIKCTNNKFMGVRPVIEIPLSEF